LLTTPAAAAACVKPESLAKLSGEQGFTQTRTLKGVKRPLTTNGTLKPEADGVVWTVTDPIQIVTRITSKGVTQAIEGGKEEPVGPAGGANPFFTETGLVDLLRGDLSRLETRYAVQRSTRTKPQGWKLSLTPKAEAVKGYIATIAVEGCQRVESIAVKQANGDMIRVDLKAGP
jgi:hypothetical protein